MTRVVLLWTQLSQSKQQVMGYHFVNVVRRHSPIVVGRAGVSLGRLDRRDRMEDAGR